MAQLLALAVAAGIDLHLAVVALGAWGLTEWTPLPGELRYLSSPLALVVMGGAYLLETGLERRPLAGIVWGILQVPVRPLGAVLLVFLASPFWAPPLAVVAAAAGLALACQILRLGGHFLLTSAPRSRIPSPLLLSLAQDAVVLVLVSLALEMPLVGGATAVFLVLAFAAVYPGLLRAALFAAKLLPEALRGALSPKGWEAREDLPQWALAGLSAAWEEDHPGEPRGARVGLIPFRAPASFRTGWLVATGGRLFLMSRLQGEPRTTVITPPLRPTGAHPLVLRITLTSPELCCVLVPLDGPAPASLRAQMEG